MAVRHLWGVPVLPRAPRPMRRVRQRRRSHGSSKEEKQEEEEEEDREVYESILWTLTMELCAGLCRCSQKPLESRERFPSWSWTGWKLERPSVHLVKAGLQTNVRNASARQWTVPAKWFLEERGPFCHFQGVA